VTQDRRMPSPSEAAAGLIMARDAQKRGRRATGRAALRASLVLWGLDWMIGYPLVHARPIWPAMALWALTSLAIYALPRLRIDEAHLLVTGWETSFRRAWWVILAGSIACGVIAGPLTIDQLLLLLGALWGVAYALYGVVVRDRPIAALGGVIIVLAVVLRLVAPAATPLFGLSAGGCTALLGLVRGWREA